MGGSKSAQNPFGVLLADVRDVTPERGVRNTADILIASERKEAPMDIQSLAALSDTDLLFRVKVLARNERRATAALVAHLAEIDDRKLFLGEACASMFVYCTRMLHLSEHAAYNRIEAARAARRFPAVLVGLEQGLVHLTAVRLLAPLLTPENHRTLLAAAAHKSKREVEELLARLRPQADVPARVRKLPAAKQPDPAPQPAPTTSSAVGDPQPERRGAQPTADPQTERGGVEPTVETPAERGGAEPAHAGTPRPRPGVVVPLAPERYKVQFTASAATRDQLRRAQELLRHRIPDGDVADIVGLALDLLVRELEKKKFAATNRPRTESTSLQHDPSSRQIPAAVKRAVWVRDQGRCTFTSATGVRCTERDSIEFDHIRPHADGGESTAKNVRLLCRRHNQYEARQYFGPWHADSRSGPVPQWG